MRHNLLVLCTVASLFVRCSAATRSMPAYPSTRHRRAAGRVLIPVDADEVMRHRMRATRGCFVVLRDGDRRAAAA